MNPANPQSNWHALEQLPATRVQANLALLQSFEPHWAHQLASHAERETLLVQPSQGLFRCRTQAEPSEWIFGESAPRDELARFQSQFKSQWQGQPLLILLGGAMGYGLQIAWQALQHQAHTHLLLVEPSAARLKADCLQLDLKPLLVSGRVHIVLQPFTAEALLESIEQYNLWFDQPPLLLQPGKEETVIDSTAFRATYATQRAQAAQARIAFTETPTPSADDATIRRVLLIDCWPNAPQTLHCDNVEQALRARSIEVERWTLPGFRFDLQGETFRNRLERRFLQSFQRNPADLIISFAYHAPQMLHPELFAASGARWLQVVSNLVYQDQAYYANESAAVAEARLLPVYRERGAPHAFYLPLMANHIADAPTPPGSEFPILFVGNSLSLEPEAIQQFWQRWQSRPHLAEAIRAAEDQLSDLERGPNLFDYLEHNPLPGLADTNEYFAIYRYLLCQATAARRRQVLEALVPHGLAVFGRWNHALPSQSPLRQALRGNLPFRQERTLFTRTRLFINIHSVANVTCPNMRFFNAAGMGSLLLSDGPFENFLQPDQEYLAYQSLAELQDKTRQALANPKRFDDLREAGWQRIRQQWTYHNWLDWAFAELGVQAPAS